MESRWACPFVVCALAVPLLMGSGGCNGQRSGPTTGRQTREFILWHSKDEEEMREFYAASSLGNQVKIERQGDWVAVQIFPYSGVDVSYLFVYRSHEGGLQFYCFIRVPSQRAMEFNSTEDGDVEMTVDSSRLAVLSRESSYN